MVKLPLKPDHPSIVPEIDSARYAQRYDINETHDALRTHVN